MIAALVLAATLAQGGVRTVELSRGALIQPADSTAKPFGYWDTSDTYIDGTAPDDNFGGEPVLSVGSNRTLLIRFGDLNRVLGATRHVRKATLVFTIAGGDKPALKSVDRLMVPWGPGPYFTIGALINRTINANKDDNKIVKDKPEPPRWSATWRHRLCGEGGATWQQAGANGPLDSETIAEAKGQADEKEVSVSGLASAVQYMANHPSENFGFALRFDNSCEFYASRAPTGRPRLLLELDADSPPTGPDLSVVAIQRVSPNGSNPKPGEEVTYRAHVKNVGNAAATGFGAQWLVNEKPGAPIDVAEALAPGAETVLTMHKAYRIDKTDHRTQTVELRITPKGPDAVPTNNSLSVYDNAKEIDVLVPASLAKEMAINSVGSRSIEDWVQEQVRVFNDTYAGQSRFSFAPDGVKERVAVQHIVIGAAIPQDGAHADGAAAVPDDETDWQSSDPRFFRSIGLAIGLPDFTTMSFPGGRGVLLKSGGKPVDRGTTDIFPGVVGYGDTRYEGVMAGQVSIPYEPYASAASALMPLVPTGLLSATDAAILNGGLDHAEDPFPMPKTTLLKVSDLEGHPLNNVQLDFFQSKGGQIPDGPPAFSVTTSQTLGTALLPSKAGAGPYGKLTPNGDNGTFLIRATAFGVTEWSWLKGWQLIDTANRGNLAAGILEVRFDLPSAPLDSSVDLARDRIISDSTNQLPATLGALLSGGTQKEVTLGGKPGDWVEIDLGRDRTIGEITLLGAAGEFWPQFDILVYATGQKPSEASLWAGELNWSWAASNRRDKVDSDPNTVSVSYRAPDVRIRFIRIVNRSSTSGKLKGIRVVPIKISQ